MDCFQSSAVSFHSYFILYSVKNIYCFPFFYSFHISHCKEALMHTDGDLGRALEILFYKYYKIEEIPTNEVNVDEADLLEQLREEKETMESIYGDAFHEKIKNRIWTVQLKLGYLTNNQEAEEVTVKEKKQEKEICRLFIRNKCRFGDKCRFLHQLPKKVSNTPVQEDPYFTLEIRFPEGMA